MIKTLKTVDLYCNCGNKVSHSFENSEHFCRICDAWLVFRQGKVVQSTPMEAWKMGLTERSVAIK